jgi:hypothetical protein
MNTDITTFGANSETIEVRLNRKDHPRAFKKAVESLMESGLSEEEATKSVATTPFVLEVAYSTNRGLFAVESEALDFLREEMFDPYTGENVAVEDEEETPPPSYENKDGIEITPEILEKNFGYARGIGWYDVYFVREDEHDEHYFVTKYIAIRDAYRYPNKARFSIIRDNEDNVLFNVKYVHELQRAFRILGIDKNIIP